MAGDNSRRTEPPTPRRVEKARREGQFFSSREMVSAAQFAVFTVVLAACGAGWFANLNRLVKALLATAFEAGIGPADLIDIFRKALWRGLIWPAAAGGLLAAVALATQLAMTRMGLSFKRLAPDMRRLNPVKKLRDLFRQNAWALVRALVMLPVLGAAVWAIAGENLRAYLALPLVSVAAGFERVTGSIMELLWKAAAVFAAFGAADLLIQWRRYGRDLRMTRQEVREEAKELEGNPHVKSRIRRLQRDVFRRRMMKEVKTATAVIVNPTHYAVALRYNLESATAPVVVAKGKNYLARRIRSLAVEHQVPLVENPPLAQALYKAVEVGQEIPAHLYRAVAEVLAYIYRLMNGRLPG